MTTDRHGIVEKRGNTGVLLVHGITGSPAEMRPLVRKLAAQGFSVSCPQLAGHCSNLADLKRTRWTDWYKSLERAMESLAEECIRADADLCRADSFREPKPVHAAKSGETIAADDPADRLELAHGDS